MQRELKDVEMDVSTFYVNLSQKKSSDGTSAGASVADCCFAIKIARRGV
jgi:hypothetical protein